MKKIILTLFILFTLVGCSRQEWLGARTSDFWKTVGNNLRPIDDNYNVQIPSLSNCNTIDTDAWGKLVCGTDEVGGGGGGGSGLWATSSDDLLIYPLSDRAVVVGGTATTSDVQFEVIGDSAFDNIVAGAWQGDVIGLSYGGTGISTAPSYGQLLMGNNSGGYNLVATSSLGLGLGGTVQTGSQGQIAYYGANGDTVTGTSSLFIAQNGNVGIGTTSPSAKLEIDGDLEFSSEGNKIIFADNTVGAGRKQVIRFFNSEAGFHTLYDGSQHRIYLKSYGGDTIFMVDNGGIFYDELSYTPSYIGYIRGSASNTWGNIGQYYRPTDTGNWRLEKLADGDEFQIWNWNNVIINSGNLGVGTTSPSQRLSVEGNVLADNYYGTWQGSPITDAYVADDITASNYLSLTAWYSTTTDAIVEGSNNLYWTQARFNSAFSAKTTDDLAEGSTNKYYSTNLFAADLAATTTDALSEGTTNLYYTNGRVDSHLSGGTGITYSSGNISFDCSEVEGTGINCSGESITLDNTGDWTGTLDGYEGTAFVLRNDWTTIDNYPTGCSAGEYVQAIGDTLTCATDQDTTYSAGGTLLQLSGTQFSLKEGTLTDGKLCRYDTTDGLVCDYTDQDTTYTAGNHLTLTGTQFDVDDDFLLNTGDTGTGVYNFGGATSLEIPNGTAPTTDTAGEIAVDTTNTDHLIFYGDQLNNLVPYREKCFTVASTTFESYDNIPLWSPHQAITVTDIYCRVDGGTSVVVTCGDGTNNMDSITCDTDGQADDGSIANNTFNANERFECDFGTVTGDVNWLNYCITYTIDRD